MDNNVINMDQIEECGLFPSEGNTLLIFGNGFDLNLGFATSYKDFFNSDRFPFVHNDHSCHSLGHFVYNKGVQEKWYNLEDILAEYGCNEHNLSDDVSGDKEDYKNL